MQFTNDKQARSFLEGYYDWPTRRADNLYDRRTFINEFHGTKIYVDEIQYLTTFYDDTINDDPIAVWGMPTYYIIPEGKKIKPMWEYRVSITEAIKMIRKIDKEWDNGTH